MGILCHHYFLILDQRRRRPSKIGFVATITVTPRISGDFEAISFLLSNLFSARTDVEPNTLLSLHKISLGIGELFHSKRFRFGLKSKFQDLAPKKRWAVERGYIFENSKNKIQKIIRIIWNFELIRIVLLFLKTNDIKYTGDSPCLSQIEIAMVHRSQSNDIFKENSQSFMWKWGDELLIQKFAGRISRIRICHQSWSCFSLLTRYASHVTSRRNGCIQWGENV